MKQVIPTTSPADPRSADPAWPWRAFADANAIVLLHPVRVCGRGNDAGTAVVAYTSKADVGRDVRFVVPFAAFGVGEVDRIFNRGLGTGEATLVLRGDEANRIRDEIRSGVMIPGPKPFVPAVPTLEELACEAGRYGMRKREFLRTGTWGGDAGAKR